MIASDTEESLVAEAKNLGSYFDEHTQLKNLKQFRPYELPRSNKFALEAHRLLNHKYTTIADGSLTILSLFLCDFTVAAFPKSADVPVQVILYLLLFIFAFQTVITAIVYRNYNFRFFFWADVVGTLSLLVDIFLLNGVLEGAYHTTMAASDAYSTDPTQSALALRLAKVTRVLRLARKVRFIRMLKFHGKRKDDIMDSEARPAKIAFFLTNRLTKYMVMMMLILDFAASLLAANDYVFNPAKALLINLWETLPPSIMVGQADSSWTEFDNLSGNTILRLVVNGTEVISRSMEDLRYFERFQVVGTVLTATFSCKHESQTDSWYAIGNTALYLLLMGFGAWLVSRNLVSLVGNPVEAVTAVVRKLAHQVLLLSGSEQERQLVGDDYENEVVDVLVEKMALLFKVMPDKNGWSTTREEDTGARLARMDTKVNEPLAEVGAIARQVTQRQALGKGEGGSPSKRPSLIVEQHPELANLHSLLETPHLLPFFRLYLQEQLCAENLLFYQKVIEYREAVTFLGWQLYRNYISETAPQQVNVNDHTASAILTSLEKEVITASLYDDAQKEIYDLLRMNSYTQFLGSKFCAAYLEYKAKPPQHKQLHGRKGSHSASASASASVVTSPISPASPNSPLNSGGSDQGNALHVPHIQHHLSVRGASFSSVERNAERSIGGSSRHQSARPSSRATGTGGLNSSEGLSVSASVRTGTKTGTSTHAGDDSGSGAVELTIIEPAVPIPAVESPQNPQE